MNKKELMDKVRNMCEGCANKGCYPNAETKTLVRYKTDPWKQTCNASILSSIDGFYTADESVNVYGKIPFNSNMICIDYKPAPAPVEPALKESDTCGHTSKKVALGKLLDSVKHELLKDSKNTALICEVDQCFKASVENYLAFGVKEELELIEPFDVEPESEVETIWIKPYNKADFTVEYEIISNDNGYMILKPTGKERHSE